MVKQLSNSIMVKQLSNSILTNIACIQLAQNETLTISMVKCWIPLKPVLGCVDRRMHFPLLTMNRLNVTVLDFLSGFLFSQFLRFHFIIILCDYFGILDIYVCASFQLMRPRNHSLISKLKNRIVSINTGFSDL
jgi:hypothetical protein